MGATLLLVIVTPFSSRSVNIDFSWNQTTREEVVRLIGQGEIIPTSSDSEVYRLPVTYQHLSSGGGDVIATQTSGGL